MSLTSTLGLQYPFQEVCGLYSSLSQHFRRHNKRLNVPVHGRCGERRSSKVQHSARPGIEPRTSSLVVRDLTSSANLVHYVNTSRNTLPEGPTYLTLGGGRTTRLDIMVSLVTLPTSGGSSRHDLNFREIAASNKHSNNHFFRRVTLLQIK